MKLTIKRLVRECKERESKHVCHINPQYIIFARDDERIIGIEGQEPFVVTKKSYKKVVRYLNRRQS